MSAKVAMEVIRGLMNKKRGSIGSPFMDKNKLRAFLNDSEAHPISYSVSTWGKAAGA
jgi:hypothetical protein